jgi:cell division septum initiation protein DivIVA
MDEQPTTPDGPEQQADEVAPIRPPVSSSAERIQVIVEAAERAAAGVIEDAEVQARRYLEEARRRADAIAEERAGELAEITGSLVSQAHELKRQSDELIAAIDRAKARIEERVLGELGAPSPDDAWEAPEAESRADAPHLTPVGEAAGDNASPPAGARLLATQMAVAGNSRGEIEARLRTEFGIDDAGPMLDGILGPRG